MGIALAQALCSVTAVRAQVTLPTVVVHANKGPHQAKAKRRRAAAPIARAPAPAADAIPPIGPPVTATTAGPVSGYRALTAVTGTKTPTPIEQIPQTVVVLPRSVIDDQNPITQNELLHNISDVSGMPDYAPYGVYYKVRGFVAERYVDGLSTMHSALLLRCRARIPTARSPAF
jgi:iron complex outermembrane recepter protein